MQEQPPEYGCCHFLGLDFERKMHDFYFLYTTGIYTASIMSNGDIGGCLDIERHPETIQGNVYHDDFVDVWKNRFGFFCRDLAELDARCMVCQDHEFCAGGSWHSFDFKNAYQRVCMKEVLRSTNGTC